MANSFLRTVLDSYFKTYLPGDRYEGNWKNGKRDGYGFVGYLNCYSFLLVFSFGPEGIAMKASG